MPSGVSAQFIKVGLKLNLVNQLLNAMGEEGVGFKKKY